MNIVLSIFLNTKLFLLHVELGHESKFVTLQYTDFNFHRRTE